MNKIAIYYIATNKYIIFFDDCFNGLNNFFPSVKKKVILITDCDNIIPILHDETYLNKYLLKFY